MLKSAQGDIEKIEAEAAKEEEKAHRRQTMAFGGDRHGITQYAVRQALDAQNYRVRPQCHTPV